MRTLALALTVGLTLTGSGRVAAQRGHPDPAPLTLTLAQALSRASHGGPVAAGLARAAGMQEAAARVPRWLNPSLEVRGENWGSAADLPLDAFVVVSQPLEVFGSRAARRGLAVAEAEASVAAARLIGRDSALEIARGYLAVLLLVEDETILAEQRTGLADIVGALRARVREGVASEADLRKFDVELANLDIQSTRLSLSLARAIGMLGAQLDLPELSPDHLARPADIEVPVVSDAAFEDAIDGRADVVAARARHERARHALALTRARARPDLQVVGGLKRTGGENTGVAAVLLPIPLADRHQAAMARDAGELRATALELDATRALARADARAAQAAAAALRDQSRTTAGALVEPATIVREAARAAFREGSFDPLRLVDAERAWTEARRTRAALSAQATLAAIEARLALGLEALP